MFADTLSQLTGACTHTSPHHLPRCRRKLWEGDGLIAAAQALLPTELSSRGKGSSHNSGMNCRNLLAQAHLTESTAAKALCKHLQKASKLLSSPPLHSKLHTDLKKKKNLDPLIISEIGSLKIFSKRKPPKSHKRVENHVHHPRAGGGDCSWLSQEETQIPTRTNTKPTG